MKMVIIGVVALLMLGGAGAGAYFYFMKPAEASTGAEGETKKEEHGKKEKEGEHEAPSVEFVELSPLLLPIIDEKGVTQTVSLVISLEVPDVAKAEEAKKMAPRLTDAYIQDMYGILNRHVALKGNVIQVGMIKERLNKISKQVLGEDGVNDVLLQVVQQRPI